LAAGGVKVEDGLAGVVEVEEVVVAGFAGVVVVAVVAAAFGAVAHAVRVEVDVMLRRAIRYADGAALDDNDDAERRAEKLLRADVVAIVIVLVVRVCVKMEMRYLAANAKSRFLTTQSLSQSGSLRWRLHRPGRNNVYTPLPALPIQQSTPSNTFTRCSGA
jgi:hypothetical protein